MYSSPQGISRKVRYLPVGATCFPSSKYRSKKVCFGSGALVGVPLFFLLKEPIGTSTAALIMVFVTLPFFLLAMFERNGQPLEKVAKNMANVLFLRPKQRPYKTNNFYDCLARQNQLDKEVHSIIHGKKADKN